MEGEDFTAARKRVEPIGESSDDAGRFVTEGKRQSVVRYAIRKAFGILVGLGFNSGKRGARFFGFDDPGDFAVNVEAVVGFAWIEIVRGTDCSRIVALDPRSYFRRRRLRIHSYQLSRRYFVRSP